MIIVALVVLRPLFGAGDQLYAYAIGVLVGTVVQLALSICGARRIHFRLRIALDWRDPRVKRVLALMLPVTIGLGRHQLRPADQLDPRRRSCPTRRRARSTAAFRIYMLPQGMFSVAVATVLFPALSRFAARRDLDGPARDVRDRDAADLPAAHPRRGDHARARRADHPARLPARRVRPASRPSDVATALFWFSFSLPFAGVNLLLTRTFFSLQRPWIPTALAAVEPRGQRRRSASRSTSRWASRASSSARRSRAPGCRSASGGSCAGELGGRLEGRRTMAASLAITMRVGRPRRGRLRASGAILDGLAGRALPRARSSPSGAASPPGSRSTR